MSASPHSGTALTLATLALAAVAVGPAAALGATESASVVQMVGAGRDAAGVSTAPAGDVNGDGIPDAIVGAPLASHGGRISAGSAYIVFGRPGTARIDLAALGPGGVRINGAHGGDTAGRAVAGAGDLNDDGYDDVLVGAPKASNRRRASSGSAYVVFGGPALPPLIDLRRLGRAGVRIDGGSASDLLGTAVAGVGDFNGDAVPDLALGAPGASARSAAHRSRAASGAAYVVLGRIGARAFIDLRRPGRQVIRADGAAAGNFAGSSVAGVGDVDGLGGSDVLVGAPYATGTSGATATGVAYLLLGQARTPNVLDLRRVGGVVRRIDGAGAGDLAGAAVAAANDMNGDGVPDLLVGAPGASGAGRQGAGAAYAVYGQRPFPLVLVLDATPAAATRIDGASPGDSAGYAVAPAGDANGDGVPDLLVGAPDAAAQGTGAGAAYLVLGARPAPPALDLAALAPEAGGRFPGPGRGARAGFSVAAAPGFAREPFLIGAPRFSPGGRPAAPGTVYALASPEAGIPSAPAGSTASLGQVALETGAAVQAERARSGCLTPRPRVLAPPRQPVLRQRGVVVYVRTSLMSGNTWGQGIVAGHGRRARLTAAGRLRGGDWDLVLRPRRGALSRFASNRGVHVKLIVYISPGYTKLFTFCPRVAVSG